MGLPSEITRNFYWRQKMNATDYNNLTILPLINLTSGELQEFYKIKNSVTGWYQISWNKDDFAPFPLAFWLDFYDDCENTNLVLKYYLNATIVTGEIKVDENTEKEMHFKCRSVPNYAYGGHVYELSIADQIKTFEWLKLGN